MSISGYFVHQWNVRLKDLFSILYVRLLGLLSCLDRVLTMRKLIHVGNHLSGITFWTLKVAILLDWMNIFIPNRRRGYFFWTSISLMAIFALWYGGSRIAENLSCIPFERIWDKTVPGVCINWRIVNIVSAGHNLATDLIMLLLPQGPIWGLNLSVQRKLGVSAIFAAGILYVLLSLSPSM